MTSKYLSTILIFMVITMLSLPFNLFGQGNLDDGPRLDETVDYFATIETNHGTFYIRLFADKAPVTVRNFVNLAEGTRETRHPQTQEVQKTRFYDGIIFHRVISNFMIQGGDPTGTGRGGPGYRFRDEFHQDLKFDRGGLLAKANSGPNTNGSQFFITEVATQHLNNRHTIFGELLEGSEGIDLVKKIASVPKNNQDKPNQDVVMERVRIHKLEKGISDSDALNRLQIAVQAGMDEAGEGSDQEAGNGDDGAADAE